MRWWLLAKILLHPIRHLQDRIDRWVMARVQRVSGPVTLSRRRIYIVPTRYGYLFGVLLVVMLLAAMNYSNSMAFLLTFLLAGLGLVAMHHTHGTLLNLGLRCGYSAPVHASGTAHFEIFLDNPSLRPRYSVHVAWPRSETPETGLDVPATGDSAARLALPAPRRGWLRGGAFSIHTEFPFGLFHAWSWVELDQACLVYPQPAAGSLPPPPSRGQGGLHEGPRGGHDEFIGLRTYQRGDSIKSIHWKSLPKTATPMVKEFTDALDDELWLDWDALTDLDTEQRLSRLTRWVLDAESAHRPYGLRLPGEVIAPGRGEVHRHACLKSLALFGTPA
jgi:uncharacterized protein (DUF58 family)